MIPVATRDQVRELDRLAIEEVGLPGVVLMESASRALAEGLLEALGDEARADGIVVVCGGGNNGGDGFGAARWLHGRGLDVRIVALKAEARGDAAVHRAAAEALGLPVTLVHGGLSEAEIEAALDRVGLDRAGVIIDALFGTGLDRPIEGRARQIVQRMNASGCPIVAADLPSGLDADTGAVLGVCVRAAVTVSFGAAKPGLYAGEGPEHAGRVTVDTIGLDALRDAPRLGGVVQASDLVGAWPERASDAHKTRSGHLGIAAGSTAMAGAAVLCCRGALAAGAGLVTLLAPRGALSRLASLPPEVMVVPLGDGDVLAPPTSPLPALARPTAWVLGPGLGGGQPLSEPLDAWLAELWTSDERPVLADADALLPVAGPSASSVTASAPRVITPHPGEAARLLDSDVAAVQGDRFGAVQRLARPGRTALLKGPHTLIATPGQPLHVNATGNPVLATGGTGDVLAGVIGALLAAGLDGHTASTHGAFVHGLAADHLAGIRRRGWTAGDVADAIPGALDALGEGT